MKNLLLILALFVGNIYPSYLITQATDKDIENSERPNLQKEYTKIETGEIFFSNKSILKNRIFLEKDRIRLFHKGQCLVGFKEPSVRDFRFTTFSLEKTKKNKRPSSKFVRRECVILDAYNSECGKLRKVAYCLNKNSSKDISKIENLESYEFYYGRNFEYVGNQVKKGKIINLKDKGLYLERKDRYNRGHELTFRSIDKNVLNFSMIGPNVFGFNKNYEVDLGHSNSLILFDKNSNKAGYKIEFKNLSSNEVGYRIKPFTKNDLVKYEKEKFLYLLLDRCIDTYGFDTVENIKQCVQQEVFNEKQLAILREQNEILKEQNRIAQDRLDNINNYSSQFLNAFRRGITMSLISNAMQNRNSRTTIIYNNYQEPR